MLISSMRMPDKGTCIVLFSRSPQKEGREKRMWQARPLFSYCCRKLLRTAQNLEGADVLAAIEDDGAWLPSGVPRLQQGAGDFGRRLVHVLEAVRKRGYSRAIVVPGDVPGLGRGQLARAVSLLQHNDTVLGPSPDGGVYLLGVSLAGLNDLASVAWRTGSVFAQLRSRARSPAVLEDLRDVDRVNDLLELSREKFLLRELRVMLDRLLGRMRAPEPLIRMPLASCLLLSRGSRAPPGLTPFSPHL